MKVMTDYCRGIFVRRLQKKGRFYIDNEIVDRGYLKVLGKKWLVYTVLARHANAKAQLCFVSYETIMREGGTTNRNQVRKSLDMLEALNMIAVGHAKGMRSNIYYLIDSSQWKSATSITCDTGQAVSKTNEEKYQNQHLGSISSDTLNQLKKSTIEIKGLNKENVNKMKRHLGEQFTFPK